MKKKKKRGWEMDWGTCICKSRREGEVLNYTCKTLQIQAPGVMRTFSFHLSMEFWQNLL